MTTWDLVLKKQQNKTKNNQLINQTNKKKPSVNKALKNQTLRYLRVRQIDFKSSNNKIITIKYHHIVLRQMEQQMNVSRPDTTY